MTVVAQPRLCAAVMGVLLKGLGPQRVCWGTDALWTGSPQWQIEALRRLEIPEDMQLKHGFKPLGPATGEMKTAILSGNNAQLYNIDIKKIELDFKNDRFGTLKAQYAAAGSERSNLRYGYINVSGSATV
jgi:uncharacterized protein